LVFLWRAPPPNISAAAPEEIPLSWGEGRTKEGRRGDGEKRKRKKGEESRQERPAE